MLAREHFLIRHEENLLYLLTKGYAPAEICTSEHPASLLVQEIVEQFERRVPIHCRELLVEQMTNPSSSPAG